MISILQFFVILIFHSKFLFTLNYLVFLHSCRWRGHCWNPKIFWSTGVGEHQRFRECRVQWSRTWRVIHRIFWWIRSSWLSYQFLQEALWLLEREVSFMFYQLYIFFQRLNFFVSSLVNFILDATSSLKLPSFSALFLSNLFKGHRK